MIDINSLQESVIKEIKSKDTELLYTILEFDDTDSRWKSILNPSDWFQIHSDGNMMSGFRYFFQNKECGETFRAIVHASETVIDSVELFFDEKAEKLVYVDILSALGDSAKEYGRPQESMKSTILKFYKQVHESMDDKDIQKSKMSNDRWAKITTSGHHSTGQVLTDEFGSPLLLRKDVETKIYNSSSQWYFCIVESNFKNESSLIVFTPIEYFETCGHLRDTISDNESTMLERAFDLSGVEMDSIAMCVFKIPNNTNINDIENSFMSQGFTQKNDLLKMFLGKK